jgi:hypothetical protein
MSSVIEVRLPAGKVCKKWRLQNETPAGNIFDLPGELWACGLTVYAANPVRAKSVVLLVYNNQAHKYYNAKLDKIAMDYLNKKIEGLYYEADAESVQ